MDASLIAAAAAGAAGLGVVYFLYLSASKGLPAAWAWVKAKWNAGKADLKGLEDRVTALESKVVSLAKPATAPQS